VFRFLILPYSFSHLAAAFAGKGLLPGLDPQAYFFLLLAAWCTRFDNLNALSPSELSRKYKLLAIGLSSFLVDPSAFPPPVVRAAILACLQWTQKAYPVAEAPAAGRENGTTPPHFPPKTDADEDAFKGTVEQQRLELQASDPIEKLHAGSVVYGTLVRLASSQIFGVAVSQSGAVDSNFQREHVMALLKVLDIDADLTLFQGLVKTGQS